MSLVRRRTSRFFRQSDAPVCWKLITDKPKAECRDLRPTTKNQQRITVSLLPRFPLLAEPPHRLAQPHRQRGNGFQPLLSAVRKLAIIFPPHLREQQLRISENARERIIHLVAQDFAEPLAARRFRCRHKLLGFAGHLLRVLYPPFHPFHPHCKPSAPPPHHVPP